MLIKANFHSHTLDDPKHNLKYSAFNLINEAAKLGFAAIAITCHEKFVYKKEYANYAHKKGIILISGIEAKIEKRDVIILNCDKEAENLKTFSDLKKYKKDHPNIFILAPHPFVPSIPQVSLGKKLIKNINLFDAIELTVFSNNFFNFNKKALAVAKKYGKPVIATSDTHNIKDLEKGYCLIKAKEKTPAAIFQAIKEKKYENKIKPMTILDMVKFKAKGILRD